VSELQRKLPPSNSKRTLELVLVQDFGFIFVILTQKCIVNDICDAAAHFFTFPPAGSTNKRVGKVCLTFLPNCNIYMDMADLMYYFSDKIEQNV
jgi:hypothetical protein